MSWTFEIEAAQGQVVTATAFMRFSSKERGLVMTAQATDRTNSVVAASSGLTWSDGLERYYTYLGGETVQPYERAFAFAAPVSSLTIDILHWPSREPVATPDVRSLLVELASWDRSPTGARESILVFPRPRGES